MVNLAIPYSKPIPAASTMWAEVQARWPDCAENKGFVAGSGPTTWNISSHNADSNGYAHALDIGVDIEGDGTGIPIQAGIDLSEHLRAIGYKEWKSGRAGRLAYIIHRGRIAGDHTGWEWVAYNGQSPHYDHIHVSFSYDYFWGDPVWESTSDVYSTAPWGITTIITYGQSAGITPITSEEDDMPTLDEIFNHPIKRSDGKGDITLASMLRYYSADIAGITESVKPINTTKGPLSLRQAVADGRKASLEAASQTADINTATGPVSLRQFVADGTRAAQKLEPIVVEIAKAVTADPVDGA